MTVVLTKYFNDGSLCLGIQAVEFQAEAPLQVYVGLLRKQVNHRVILVLKVLLNLGTSLLLILLLQESSLLECFDACLRDNSTTTWLAHVG